MFLRIKPTTSARPPNNKVTDKPKLVIISNMERTAIPIRIQDNMGDIR